MKQLTSVIATGLALSLSLSAQAGTLEDVQNAATFLVA